MGSKPDDLEAVRTITSTLEPFDKNDQERIIRWAREKLGLSNSLFSSFSLAISSFLSNSSSYFTIICCII